jgi:hypothetical protein
VQDEDNDVTRHQLADVDRFLDAHPETPGSSGAIHRWSMTKCSPPIRGDLPSAWATAAEEAECDLGPPASNAVVMSGIAFLIFL